MDRQSSFRATRLLFAFALCLILTLAYFPLARIFAASSNLGISVRESSKPLVNAQSVRSLKPSYSGKSNVVAALKAATAVSLASADLDADGAPDLVAGYRTAKGGVVTVTRGNPDAFAPTDSSLFGKAMKGQVPDTFLSKTAVFAVPVSPDLMVTSDFNRDANRDVLIAARNGAAYLLAGDGRGGLLAAKQVPLAGNVTAMAVGAEGRIAVSLETKKGWQLAILNPGAGGFTAGAAFPLPARGDSVAWGNFGGGADVAVAVGYNVVMIYGALTANAKTETVGVPFQVRALTPGYFIHTPGAHPQIAVLADDGTVHILQHGDPTPSSAPRRRGRPATRSKQPPNPFALGSWTIAKQLPYSGSAPSGPLSASGFNSPRLAPSSTHDLLVVDAARKQVDILDTSSAASSPAAAISLSGAPVAALVLPQKINAVRDLVVLTSNQVAPTLIHANTSLTLNVNTTTDQDPDNACTNTSFTTPPATLSLREAVCIANNSAPDTVAINLPAGTYDLTDLETGELQVGNATNGYTVTIMGTGTPANTIIQQTDGVDRIFEEDFFLQGNNPFTIENVTLTGGDCTNNTSNDCGYGGGAILAGAEVGDDLTLTNVVLDTNAANPTGSVSGGGQDNGGALNFAGPNVTIANSTFSNNSSSGAGGGFYFDGSLTPTASATITNSTFSKNTAGTDPSAEVGTEGGGVFLQLEPGTTTASVSGSTFTGNNSEGGDGGGGISLQQGGSVSASFTVSNSRFDGTNQAAAGGTGVSANDGVDATLINNWWGCNAGPGGTGCDTIYVEPPQAGNPTTAATYNPWLVLSISANPTQVAPSGTSTLTGDLAHNSNGVGGFSVPDGTGITFGGGTLGTAFPASTTLTGGAASSTFTAGATTGSDTDVSATVDSQTVDTTITVGQQQVGTSIAVTNVSPASEAYGLDSQVTITAVLSWTGSGPAPTASDVTISGNGPSGYSGTHCGTPSSDTMTCTATYGPTGADTVGSYTESASFSGDSNYTSSSSTQTNNFSITQATSSTSVGSSQNPSLVGQSVTFTATIDGEYGLVVHSNGALPGGGVTLTKRGLTQKVHPHPAIPGGITGTVTWSANTGCAPSSVSGNPGTAQCTTTTLGQGTDTITATYSGDNNHSGSGGTLAGGQVVNPASTGTLTYPPTLDFGMVYLNSKHKLTGTIMNTGTANVTFTGDSITLGTADGAAYKPFLYCTGTPLKPGKTCTVAVDLLADAVGTLTATLNIMDNASGNPQQIGLTANVINPIAQFAPKTLSFGGVAVNGSKTLPVQLTNTGQTALDISNVSITGSNSTGFSPSSGCPASLAPTDSCVINVTFAPTTKGARAGSLVVTDNVAAGKSSIPLSGTGK